MANYITKHRLESGDYYYEMSRFNLGLSTERDNGYWCHLILLENHEEDDDNVVKIIGLEVVENKESLPSMLHRSQLIIKLDSGDIDLGTPFKVSKEDEYTNAAGKKHFERMAFFEISGEQLKKLCQSDSAKLVFTGGGRSKTVGSDFITWCQYFYHHMIDNSLYKDVDNRIEKVAAKGRLWNSLFWLIVLVLVVLGVVWLLGEKIGQGLITLLIAFVAMMIKSQKLRTLFSALSGN